VNDHLREATVQVYLDALASRSPTPGGGAVAGATAGTAAALGRMVLAYSIDKASLASHRARNLRSEATLADLQAMALQRADDDAAAYAELNALWRLDRDDPARRARWMPAVRTAIAVPESLLTCCETMMTEFVDMIDRTNRMLASDLAIAAILADSAGRSAAWNVRVNAPQLDDPADAAALTTDIDARLDRLAEHCRAVDLRCRGDA